MLNGNSNGSDGDNIHGKDGLCIPCNFFKPLLVGYSFENKLEIEDKGGVILTEVDEGDNVFRGFGGRWRQQ